MTKQGLESTEKCSKVKFKKGCIKKWLERLKEINEPGSVRVHKECDYLFIMRDFLSQHGMICRNLNTGV